MKGKTMEIGTVEVAKVSWIDRLVWWFKSLKPRKSNLVSYAENELKRAGLFDKGGDYDGMIGPAVLQIIKVFAKQGHSGFSASMVTSLIEKLMRFEPIEPLTGSDDEWVEYSPGRFQNNRCSHVFKDEDGVYDSEGKIFRLPDGCCVQRRGSRVPVSFPYMPKREYVDVQE